MAKSVFRPNEIKTAQGEVLLKLVHTYEPIKTPEELEAEAAAAPVYTGPTVEELQKAADDFKANWEKEKQDMIEKSKAEADAILDSARETAFKESQIQKEEAQALKDAAQAQADEILRQAQEQADKLIAEATAKQEKIESESKDTGYAEGYDKGYADGNAEVDRLIDRLHVMMTALLNRREEILSETEQQIVELVILMARKVVKVLSENQKTVVLNNVLQALKKVRGKGAVSIRVNLADLKLTTEHIQTFISRVENVSKIQVLEDSSVEPGGCIVDTDFGSIDARISSQLHELEQKIIEISPVKMTVKGTGSLVNSEA
ncbi:MAG: flagellar assembly protein FliH [Treponema sp.]|nr:flagellar assembly protein FliH [Treponema sp.]